MSYRIDTKMTRLIKRVTRVIFGLSGLTRNPPVYYSCYTCQPEFDIKLNLSPKLVYFVSFSSCIIVSCRKLPALVFLS